MVVGMNVHESKTEKEIITNTILILVTFSKYSKEKYTHIGMYK